jgi:hypothetical protein
VRTFGVDALSLDLGGKNLASMIDMIFNKLFNTGQKLLFILENVESFSYIKSFVDHNINSVEILITTRHDNLTLGNTQSEIP